MANRRMFSPDIVQSDAFLDMPSSTQTLYFHLGMRADDDGFVNPRHTMRLIGAEEDSLKILITKKFVVPFENGVVVIKHWRINNFIRKDRYRETNYIREKSTLFVRANQAYTLNTKDAVPIADAVWKKDSDYKALSDGQPLVNQRSTQVRLGKVRLSNTNTCAPKGARVKKIPEYTQLGAEVIKAFEEIDPKNKTYYANRTQRAAADFLIAEHGLDKVLKVIQLLNQTNGVAYFPTISSPNDLKEKWVKLESALARKKTEPLTRGRGVEL